MRFLTFVRCAENQGQPPQALMDAMGRFIRDMMADGSLVQTEGLVGSAEGTRLRAAKGKLTVVDGPFTESKEVIGGYAILETRTREDALAVARAFMQLHVEHWPEWEGEGEVRQIDGMNGEVLAPSVPAP